MDHRYGRFSSLWPFHYDKLKPLILKTFKKLNLQVNFQLSEDGFLIFLRFQKFEVSKIINYLLFIYLLVSPFSFTLVHVVCFTDKPSLSNTMTVSKLMV